MWLLLLVSCDAIEGARFMQATEAHRLALTLHAGKCWGLEVLDTLERLPDCVPGQSQNHKLADELSTQLIGLSIGASATDKLWLGLNAQRAGSVAAWDVGVALITSALDEGLPVSELRAVRPWLMRPSAFVHIAQWESAQIVLEEKDPALEQAWMRREEALAGARPWTTEGLAALETVPPDWVTHFEAAMALQRRMETLDATAP